MISQMIRKKNHNIDQKMSRNSRSANTTGGSFTRFLALTAAGFLSVALRDVKQGEGYPPANSPW